MYSGAKTLILKFNIFVNFLKFKINKFEVKSPLVQRDAIKLNSPQLFVYIVTSFLY